MSRRLYILLLLLGFPWSRLPAQPLEVWFLFAGDPQTVASRSKAITEGITARTALPLAWKTIDLSANAGLFESDDWAMGASLIIYDAPPHLGQPPEMLDRILAPHRKGLPALLIHRALSPPSAEGEKWVEFCGATGGEPAPPCRLTVEIPPSLSTQALPWILENEAPLQIPSVSPGALVFALANPPGGPVAWAHAYSAKQARVAAFSIGSSLDSLSRPEYLELLAGGVEWALHKAELPLRLSPPFSLGRNLLSTARVSASSGDAGNAIDLAPETAWTPAAGQKPAWWGASMAEAAPVKAVAIAWNATQMHDYLIEGTLDNRKWFPLVESQVNTLGNHVSLHLIDRKIRQLRVSNPVSLVLNPIRELAAYSSLESIPSHLRSLQAQFSVPEIIHSSPDEVRRRRSPVLKPDEALALLDSSRDPAHWDKALDALSLAVEPSVVEALIQRIGSSSSGRFRGSAISALAALYRDRANRTWEKSETIAAFLEGLFENKRTDRNRLLADFCRNAIPIKDLDRILSLDRSGELNTELIVKAMEQNYVPWKKAGVLRQILRDGDVDAELRLRAATLLAGSSDFPGMREAFGLAVDNDLHDETFLAALLNNPSWEGQLDWLFAKSNHPSSDHRRLAWQILLLLLGSDLARPETRSAIAAHMDKAEGELSCLSLMEVAHLSQDPAVSRFLNKASASKMETVSKAAALALAERNRLEAEKPARIPLHSLSAEQTAAALLPDSRRDPEKGAAIARRDCSRCHESGAPGLKNMASRLKDDAAWVESIRKPGQQVDPAFFIRHFTLKNGGKISGFLAEENDTSLVAVDQAGNRLKILKSSIAGQSTQPASAMPPGVADHLTTGEFSDLIAYLKTL